MADDPFLSAAEDLYALVPGEFTAARKERAATAKTSGDKELGQRIGRMRKPAMAAWVVNQLMRHRAEQMGQLLELGESLRQAQADLDADAMRELGRQRRQVTAAISRQGRTVAHELGVQVSDSVVRQVEETLHAAMVDVAAAGAVRSGLLAEPLSATGLGSLDVDAVLADAAAMGHTAAAAPAEKTSATDGPTLTVVPDDTREREEAAAALAEARDEAAKAAKKAAKAAKRLARAAAPSLERQAHLEEVRRRAAALEHGLEAADDELDAARATSDSASPKAAQAEVAEQEARERLKRLDG